MEKLPFDKNRRRFMRFRDADNKMALLRFTDSMGEPVRVTGLIIDESYRSLACVYIHYETLNIGDEVILEETDELVTRCRVVRAKALDFKIQFVAIIYNSKGSIEDDKQTDAGQEQAAVEHKDTQPGECAADAG